MTHTVATLGVSPAAYDEIAVALRRAGYHDAFMHDGSIDLSGIAIEKAVEVPGPPPPAPPPPEPPPLPEGVEGFRVTREWIEAHKTPRGGYRTAQVHALGEQFVDRGWIDRAVGRIIDVAKARKFEELGRTGRRRKA
jgi:hypothetical protein